MSLNDQIMREREHSWEAHYKYLKQITDIEYYLSKQVIDKSRNLYMWLGSDGASVYFNVIHSGSVEIICNDVKYEITDDPNSSVIGTWRMKVNSILRIKNGKLQPFFESELEDITMEESLKLDSNEPTFIQICEEIPDDIGVWYKTSDGELISEFELQKHFFFWEK